MKKLLIVLLALTLTFASTLTFAACSDKNDETVLNIVCLNKGYGRAWIDELVKKFEADHPGYTVNLEATSSARTLITSHIYAKDNVDDLYISVGADWMTYAAQGKFATLDDIMDDTVDGVKLKDKVADEYQNSILYPDKNGNLHTYRLPWISATGGIYYNAKMFEANGWEVPKTYEELLALCNEIANAKVLVDNSSTGDLTYVKPLVYTSQNPDYFDYTVYTWWAQLAGKAAIDEFMQYSSADNYSVSSPTYAKLKTATELWYGLFDKSKGFALERTSNNDAQLAFCNGEAAMMFNSDWMYNEVQNYQLDSENFSLAVMKTPTAPGAVDPNILYTVGEDQYIAIPATSIKQDLAKDFIKLMVSDYGCKTFLQKANGVLAYKCNFSDADTQNEFLKNLMKTRNEYTTKFTSYPSMQGQVVNTTKMLYLTSQIDIWGTSALRPYDNLLNTKDYTMDKAFETIHSQMTASWSKMLAQAGVK